MPLPENPIHTLVSPPPGSDVAGGVLRLGNPVGQVGPVRAKSERVSGKGTISAISVSKVFQNSQRSRMAIIYG